MSLLSVMADGQIKTKTTTFHLLLHQCNFNYQEHKLQENILTILSLLQRTTITTRTVNKYLKIETPAAKRYLKKPNDICAKELKLKSIFCAKKYLKKWIKIIEI